MTEGHREREPTLLVATEDQAFGSAVAEAIDRAGVAATATPVEPDAGELTDHEATDVAGAFVDGRIAQPATLIEHLTEQVAVPAVLLADGGGDDDTIAAAVAAGATDVCPRSTAGAQYELAAERLVADGAATGQALAAEDTTYREAYEGLFEKVSTGLVVHDPETGEILDVNERFCEMNGYERAELVGEPISIVTAPEEGYGLEAAEEMIQRARSEGPQAFEWRNQRRDGDTFPVEIDLTVIEIGESERVLASVEDITERKRREREYEQIFNSVQDAITVHNPDTGEMVDVNDTFCELIGYDREEILEMGTTGVSVTAEGYTEEYAEEVIAEVMNEGEMGPYEWMVETKEGERRVTEVVATKGTIEGEERVISINRDVTERKRREREYEQIFDGVKDPIAVFDPDTGEITAVNEPYHEMIGYDDLETIRELGIEGLSAGGEEYTEARGAELIREVSETGEAKTVEWEAETASGERRYLDITLSPGVIRGEDRVLTIQRDITERKRREREYEQIFDSVKDAITVFDPEAGEITEVNDAYREMLGYDLERIRELGIEGLSATEEGYTGDRGWTLIREVAETGESETTEWRAETSEGDRIWLEVTLTAAEIGGERRVLSIQRDVTERKRREQEYEQIFNGVNDSITIHDPETGELLDVNDALCDLLGHDREEIIENGVMEYTPVEEGYSVEEAKEFIRTVVETGEPRRTEWAVETADGKIRQLEVTGTTVDIGGELRYVAIDRDVTDRKRREQRLEVFNRILRHNLRNQLDVVRSHAEELLDRTTDDHAERIVAAVDELAAIGRRAREIDRIMSDDAGPTRVDIARSLRETVDGTDRPRGDVTVRTEIPEAIQLRTNEQPLTLAVESALENAIEHAASAVTVALEDSPEGCVITIDDDGPGIPEEELIPIEADTETRLQHGRGLGLWQLRWCVDKLNGRLTVETEAGTTVRISVPDRRESR